MKSLRISSLTALSAYRAVVLTEVGASSAVWSGSGHGNGNGRRTLSGDLIAPRATHGDVLRV